MEFPVKVTLENGTTYDLTIIFERKKIIFEDQNYTDDKILNIDDAYVADGTSPGKGIALYSDFSEKRSENRLLSIVFNTKDKNIENEIKTLSNYLFTIPKNILLFVNGYRKVSLLTDVENLLTTELPRGNDQVTMNDLNDYWDGIDQQFILRIGGTGLNSLRIYADGHDRITTSNHIKNGTIPDSKMNFLESMLSSQDAVQSMMQSGPAVGNSAPTMVENKCYHMASCVKLHTEPNVTGFNTRLANGKKAGQNMAAQLKSGSLATIKDANGNFTGVIDIVAHSMGYAYALGMVGELKNAGYKLGKFYIIAPENACSGNIDLDDFEEVWQYGSNEKVDALWEQDGVAPQCSVNGLPPNPSSGSVNGRIYIPQGNPNRDFVGAHAISSYGWILTTRLSNQVGYVKERK